MNEQTVLKLADYGVAIMILATIIFIVYAVVYWMKNKSKLSNGNGKVFEITKEFTDCITKIVSNQLSIQTNQLETNHFEHLIDKLEKIIIASHLEQNKYFSELINKNNAILYDSTTTFLFRFGNDLAKKIKK